MPRNRIVILLALLIVGSGTALSQHRNRGRRATSNPQPSTRSQATNTDPYWEAQRSIEAAIQQLESYLRTNPDGERANTARQQLEVLRNLSLSASRPEWTNMNRIPVSGVPQWRIALVNQQADRTKVSIEIRCPRQDGGDCYFY